MTPEERRHFYDKAVQLINESRGHASHNGIRITKLEEDHCEGELTVTPDVLNPLGIVHGGCLAALADTVAGMAAISRGRGTVTLNYGFSFLRQARGARIRCVAEPEKVGGSVSVFRCSLFDDEGELVASGQFTFYMLDMKLAPDDLTGKA